MKPAVALLAVTLGLAGCGSAPLSFVEGMPQTRADGTLYPVRVVSVDGAIEFGGPAKPVQLSPGPRWLVLEAAPGQGARSGVQKSFVFKVEPCTHYVLAARRHSPMDADWSLVVDRKEPVQACNANDELAKAKQSDGATRAAPSASSPQ